MNIKKISLYVIILAVLGYSGTYGYRYIKKQQETTIKLFGNIDIRQSNLGFKVAGQLVDLKVEEGDAVKSGQLLAELDSEPYKVKLNQAKAQLEQAKAVSKNANLLYKRNFSLCKKKLISQQECDNITTKKQQADANVKLAQAVVDEAKLSYNYTKLYAFDDGVVLTRIYEKGTILNAGYPVYSMILNKNMWVRTYIDEVNLGKVKLGTKVKIYADFSDKAYEGHIGFISPMAEFTPKNIETESLRPDLVYKIRVLVDNPDDYLKQGMPVTLEINK